MIIRKKITLEAKPIFERYIKKNIANSTYNFTNMFMWEQNGGITYAEVAGCLVLFFQFGKGPITATLPVGDDIREAVRVVSHALRKEGLTPVFRNLSEDMVKRLEELFPSCFEFIYDRNDSDYIYETQKLISLSGKKLHSKRNHYNYFLHTYPFTYIELTHDDARQCRQLFDEWIVEKEDLSRIESSRTATYTLLDNFDGLGVTGGAIKVGNDIIAFSVGEAVTSDTALIHVEYASPLYRGAFNVINQQFCEHAWSSYRYINREEDMGLPGLRSAKLAYRPAYLLDKYNAVLTRELPKG